MGCGTSNSASTVETVTQTVTAGAQRTTPPATPTSTTATSTPAQRTRTGEAPSFTGGTAAGGASAGTGLSSAVAKLRSLGFSPLATSTYNAGQTLRVLVGARSGSADQRTQQAFFFNGSRYLGTDARSTSAEIRVSGQSDTSVTLTYGLYKRSDPLCCSSGGTRNVRFQLDMGRLMAIDPIPSVAERR